MMARQRFNFQFGYYFHSPYLSSSASKIFWMLNINYLWKGSFISKLVESSFCVAFSSTSCQKWIFHKVSIQFCSVLATFLMLMELTTLDHNNASNEL